MSAPEDASKQKEPLVAASNAAAAETSVAAPQVEAAASNAAAETSVAAPQVEAAASNAAAAPQVEAAASNAAAAPQVEAETTKPVAAPNAAAAPQVEAAAPQVEAAAPQVEAASNAAETPVVPNPVTLPQDKSYSTALGAVVHALAELYGIKDNANVIITSDKVSAANFKATIETNDDKLTITMTPVADSEGVTALTEIKSKLAAPKPEPTVEQVIPVAGTVEPAAVEPVEAAAEPVKQVEAEEPVKPEAAGTVKGGYRRRKRNLRTIKKQQQRNRRTMNKH